MQCATCSSGLGAADTGGGGGGGGGAYSGGGAGGGGGGGGGATTQADRLISKTAAVRLEAFKTFIERLSPVLAAKV